MQTDAAEAERLLQSTLEFEPIDSPPLKKIKAGGFSLKEL